MSNLGKVNSRHRKNASLSLTLYGLGVLLLAVGGFLALVMNKAKPEAQQILLATVAGLIVIGLILCVAGRWAGRRGVFILCENGVRVERSGMAREYLFGQIAETCQMYRTIFSVGIAFREQNGAWESANAHLSRYAAFRTGLMKGYINARLPVLLQALKNGKTVNFKVRASTLKGKAQQAMASGIHAYVDYQTDNVSLTAHTLTMRGQTLDIHNVIDCEMSDSSPRMLLLHRDDSVTTLDYTEFFEPEMLQAILKNLNALPHAADMAA